MGTFFGDVQTMKVYEVILRDFPKIIVHFVWVGVI